MWPAEALTTTAAIVAMISHDGDDGGGDKDGMSGQCDPNRKLPVYMAFNLSLATRVEQQRGRGTNHTIRPASHGAGLRCLPGLAGYEGGKASGARH